MVSRAVDENFSHFAQATVPVPTQEGSKGQVSVCLFSPPQTQFLNCLSTNHSKYESQTYIGYFWATSTINKKTDGAEVTVLRQSSSSHSQ